MYIFCKAKIQSAPKQHRGQDPEMPALYSQSSRNSLWLPWKFTASYGSVVMINSFAPPGHPQQTRVPKALIGFTVPHNKVCASSPSQCAQWVCGIEQCWEYCDHSGHTGNSHASTVPSSSWEQHHTSMCATPPVIIVKVKGERGGVCPTSTIEVTQKMEVETMYRTILHSRTPWKQYTVSCCFHWYCRNNVQNCTSFTGAVGQHTEPHYTHWCCGNNVQNLGTLTDAVKNKCTEPYCTHWCCKCMLSIYTEENLCRSCARHFQPCRISMSFAVWDSPC